MTILLFTSLLSELISSYLPVCKCNRFLEHCFEDPQVKVKGRHRSSEFDGREDYVCVCVCVCV